MCCSPDGGVPLRCRARWPTSNSTVLQHGQERWSQPCDLFFPLCPRSIRVDHCIQFEAGDSSLDEYYLEDC